jgi:AcrR family transcriptional regulator
MTEDRSDITDRSSNSARQARQERRRDRSREEILDAARVVLLRSGAAAMTLDAVAKEAGMSKTGLYYYYPSKDALVFELVFGALEGHAQTVDGAVRAGRSGGEMLGAIVRETVDAFAPRLDDFRLAFLFGQVAGAGAIHWTDEQLARIRPLNEQLLAHATRTLADESRKDPPRAAVEPRLLAFLAYLAAIGLLTMKGMVEHVEDPLVYSDQELIEGFARVFAAAASP